MKSLLLSVCIFCGFYSTSQTIDRDKLIAGQIIEIKIRTESTADSSYISPSILFVNDEGLIYKEINIYRDDSTYQYNTYDSLFRIASYRISGKDVDLAGEYLWISKNHYIFKQTRKSGSVSKTIYKKTKKKHTYKVFQNNKLYSKHTYIRRGNVWYYRIKRPDSHTWGKEYRDKDNNIIRVESHTTFKNHKEKEVFSTQSQYFYDDEKFLVKRMTISDNETKITFYEYIKK